MLYLKEVKKQKHAFFSQKRVLREVTTHHAAPTMYGSITSDERAVINKINVCISKALQFSSV